jgi:hypothetical protein
LPVYKPPERAAFFIRVEAHFLEGAMKKFFIVLLFAICFSFPAKAHASGIIGGAMTSGILALMQGTNVAHYATVVAQWIAQAKNMVESIEHLKNQLQHLKRTEERALKNLKSIVNIRSFEDFIGWFNRVGYLAQESERIYGDLSVKIGGKNYGLMDIDEIPDALRSEYVDRHWGDLSEDEKYTVWKNLGLAPSNYFYLKTWQTRNEDLKKRFLAAREIHADEFEYAADRNNEMLEEYSLGDVEPNEIAMNSHATQMQIEMVLRDLALSLDDLKDYIVARDLEDKVLPNPMVPSQNWNYNPYKPIIGGTARDSFRD